MAPYRQTTLDTAGREYDERRRIQQNMTMTEWLKVAIFTSAVIAAFVVIKEVVTCKI